MGFRVEIWLICMYICKKLQKIEIIILVKYIRHEKTFWCKYVALQQGECILHPHQLDVMGILFNYVFHFVFYGCMYVFTCN